ncbi:MAG: RDD family protein [Acidimicrobiaceae bacterium]|uniref:RDD family protein n=1 Tax=Candidatus Poriferisodalis sp. TaxID=3101277 RepID=UPI00229CDB69|nr:RDD family protein [Acidimicrobiaceae bacterium]
MEPETPPEREISLDDFAAGPFRRLTAYLIDNFLILTALVFWFLIFVYLAWWLLVLGRGRTPGKQLAGIFAVRRDGSRFGWGRMFIRENFKLLFWTLTLGLGSVADIAAILLRKDRRSVTDLVTGSVLVYAPSG